MVVMMVVAGRLSSAFPAFPAAAFERQTQTKRAVLHDDIAGKQLRGFAINHGFLAVLQVSRKAAEGGGQIADFTRLVTGGGGAAKKAGV